MSKVFRVDPEEPSAEVINLAASVLRKGGIVVFSLDGLDPATVSAQLHGQRINTSTATTSRAWHDLGARGMAGVVRESVHYYNSEDEIDAVVAAVDAVR